MFENFILIIAVIGISILVLSFVYYVFSLFNLALFKPLINFIKIKLGLKEKDDNFNKDDSKEVDEIISEKHGKLIKTILDFFNSINSTN